MVVLRKRKLAEPRCGMLICCMNSLRLIAWSTPQHGPACETVMNYDCTLYLQYVKQWFASSAGRSC